MKNISFKKFLTKNRNCVFRWMDFKNLCARNFYRQTRNSQSNNLLNKSKLSFFSDRNAIDSDLNSNPDNKSENSQYTIDMQTYLKEVDKVLNHIYETIDVMDLEIADNVQLSDGVLKVSFKKGKHYVLNIQRPNLQIWLSSPFSGPQRFHFNFDTGTWENIRNKKPLLIILDEEFNQILKSENINKTINLV